jgi:putative hydrolase of the HAD superfamily
VIRGVLLDVGGVLLLPDADVVSDVLTAASLSFAWSFDEAHFAGVSAIDNQRGQGEDIERYLRAYAETLQMADPDAALAPLRALWQVPSIELWRRVVTGSREGLRALAERSTRLAIVSNSDGTVEQQLRVAEICQIGPGAGVAVMSILDSSVVGVAKPDPAMFTLALDSLGLPPDEVAFVGDTVRYDVGPAESCGLHAFHFDPHHICADRAHKHIYRLAELAPLISAQ